MRVNLKYKNDLKMSYVSQCTENLNGNLREFARKNGINERNF